ncbi:MAG: TMEM165/GDT1 family protein [Ruminococcaceae bacterium]|nr:TMEM165/GDT1 family protein [Oscillospiraceae bacterium]
MELFLGVFISVFVAEMGDKTQFLMIAMASRHKARDIIVGVLLAIGALNALAICVGVLLGGVLPRTAISIAAGLAFFFFAYSSLSPLVNEEGENDRGKRGKSSVFGVFCTFFVAELGDKTQLTALTEAAESASKGFELSKILLVFAAASVALFAADLLGLGVGYFLGKALPTAVFSVVSFCIFSVFGTVKLIDGLSDVFTSSRIATIAICSAVTMMFLFASYLKGRKIYVKQKKTDTT